MPMLIVASVLALAVAAPAPEARAFAEELAGWIVGELTGPLGLSESQVEQVRPLLVADVERIEATYAGYGGHQGEGGMEGLEREIAESKARTMAALESVLSPTQLEQLKVIQKERGEEVGGQLIVHRLQGLLDLTPEQRDQLAPIFAEDLRQRRELMADAGKSAGTPRAMRSIQGEMKKLEQRLEEQLVPILSEQQMTVYREYQNAMRMQMRERMKDAR